MNEGRGWISTDPLEFAKYVLDEMNCHYHGRRINPTRWLSELISDRDAAIAASRDTMETINQGVCR